MSTQHNLVAVERVPYGNNVVALREAITKGLAREPAYSVMIDLPNAATPYTVDSLRSSVNTFKRGLMDMSWPGQYSAASHGLIPSLRDQYDAMREPFVTEGAQPVPAAAGHPEAK
jgi:hypothetical protein